MTASLVLTYDDQNRIRKEIEFTRDAVNALASVEGRLIAILEECKNPGNAERLEALTILRGLAQPLPDALGALLLIEAVLDEATPRDASDRDHRETAGDVPVTERSFSKEVIDDLAPEWLKSTDAETALGDFAAYIEALGDMMWTTESVREDSWQVIGRHLCFMAMDVGKLLERQKAARGAAEVV